MASHSEVDHQLKRLASLYRPLQPAALKDGSPNPAHVAMRGEYHRCLSGFSAHELVMGFDDLIASWKYQSWPSPAECAAACRYHTKRERPKRLPHMKPLEPEEEFTPEHCALMRRGYLNCIKWIKTGEIKRKTPRDGLATPCDDVGVERRLSGEQLPCLGD